MKYAEFPPPPDLAPLVRCFWQLEGPGDEAATAEPALPDGSPELIVNLGAPFEHVADDGRAERQPEAFLVGQITGPMHVRPTGVVNLLAIRFEAHGAAILHPEMRTITNRWVALDDLPGRPFAGVVDRLRAAGGRAARATALAAVLRAHVRRARPADARVAEAVRAIRDSHGAVTGDELSDRLGLTPRSLQRLFGQQVGITPKQLARIARFQRVFAAWRDDRGQIARVALECGYYDQSHLVRDFRDFAGEAPARLLSALPAFTAFFTARA